MNKEAMKVFSKGMVQIFLVVVFNWTNFLLYSGFINLLSLL